MQPGMSREKKKSDAAAGDGSMSVSGHLRELRNRILISLGATLAGFVLCLSFAPKILTMLMDMGNAYGYRFVYIAPQELLMVQLSVALIGALVVAFPVIAYHVYGFCSPGLRAKERTVIVLALLAGTAFFLIGIFFAYFITVPFMLHFLIQFTGVVSVSASISIQEYVNFLLTVFIIFGLVFEMPVISSLLSLLGILKAEWLKKARKPAIVLIFLVAAIITPPDVVSQIMVAIPMLALYEVSIVLCRVFARRKPEQDPDNENEEQTE